jgi:hypothetical protein
LRTLRMAQASVIEYAHDASIHFTANEGFCAGYRPLPAGLPLCYGSENRMVQPGGRKPLPNPKFEGPPFRCTHGDITGSADSGTSSSADVPACCGVSGCSSDRHSVGTVAARSVALHSCGFPILLFSLPFLPASAGTLKHCLYSAHCALLHLRGRLFSSDENKWAELRIPLHG